MSCSKDEHIVEGKLDWGTAEDRSLNRSQRWADHSAANGNSIEEVLSRKEVMLQQDIHSRSSGPG